MDMMEANNLAFHTTPHRCNNHNVANHYYSCDRGGCGKAIHDFSRTAYGPGGQYRINTYKWFHVKIDFRESGGTLNEIVVSLTQGSSSFSFTIADKDCASGYLADMSNYLRAGMTTVFSNWGGASDNLSWLDGFTGCKGKCYNNPDFSVTKMVFNTAGHSSGGGNVPSPSP